MQTLVRFWSAILDLCSQIAHLKVSLRDSDRLPGLSPVGAMAGVLAFYSGMVYFLIAGIKLG